MRREVEFLLQRWRRCRRGVLGGVNRCFILFDGGERESVLTIVHRMCGEVLFRLRIASVIVYNGWQKYCYHYHRLIGELEVCGRRCLELGRGGYIWRGP